MTHMINSFHYFHHKHAPTLNTTYYYYIVSIINYSSVNHYLSMSLNIIDYDCRAFNVSLKFNGPLSFLQTTNPLCHHTAYRMSYLSKVSLLTEVTSLIPATATHCWSVLEQYLCVLYYLDTLPDLRTFIWFILNLTC